jgi:hypothetical protein
LASRIFLSGGAARDRTGKRKAVVIIRERNGRSLPAVFRTEGQALSFIRARIAKGTIINADEGRSFRGDWLSRQRDLLP